MTVELYDPSRTYAPPVGARLTYRGGKLLTSPKLVGLYFDDFPYAREMASFLDWYVQSDVLRELQEYNVSGTGTHIGDAQLTLANLPAPPPPPPAQPPPAQKCPPGCHAVHHHRGLSHLMALMRHRAQAATGMVTDAALQARLLSAISAGSVPAPDGETLYLLFLPPGVTVIQGTDASCVVFCGYHDAISEHSPELYYAVIAFPSCDGCLGPLATFEAITSVTTHEIAEAVTDAVPGTGWYDDQNGEIGDICSWQTRQDGPYSVQREWSNAHAACV
jgi:hypothetical protein